MPITRIFKCTVKAGLCNVRMEIPRILYYKQLFLGFHSVTIVERYLLKKKGRVEWAKKLGSA